MLEAVGNSGRKQLLRLIEDIADPLRNSTPPVGAAVLTWHGGLVVQLAREIYDEQAFVRLPILADALLDAGCDNEELICHCRRRDDHVRGCWALDVVIGKS